MDVNIRTMEERDLPAASRIYNQSAVATTYSYTVVNTNVEDRLSWWRELIADSRPLLVAEVDGTMAGYANYHRFREGARTRGGTQTHDRAHPPRPCR